MSTMSQAELSAWIITHRNLEALRKSNPAQTDMMAYGSQSFSNARSRPKPSLSDTRFAEEMATGALEALTDISLRDPTFEKIAMKLPKLLLPVIEAGIAESKKRPIGDWRFMILSLLQPDLLTVLIEGFTKEWKKQRRKAMNEIAPKAKPKTKKKAAPKKAKKVAKKTKRK